MGTFWNVGSITGTTINFIDTPVIGKVSFLIPLYILLVFIAAVIFLIMRRDRTQVKRHAVVRALLLAFVTAAVLFALRMDYGWYKMWQLDRKGLSPGSLDESISLTLRPIYSFARDFKMAMPSVEKLKIYTSDSYGNMVLKYYLLPIIVSEHANYIVIFSDNSAAFDPKQNMLLKDGNVAEKNVALAAAYEGKFFIFRKSEKRGEEMSAPSKRKNEP